LGQARMYKSSAAGVRLSVGPVQEGQSATKALSNGRPSGSMQTWCLAPTGPAGRGGLIERHHGLKRTGENSLSGILEKAVFIRPPPPAAVRYSPGVLMDAPVLLFLHLFPRDPHFSLSVFWAALL